MSFSFDTTRHAVFEASAGTGKTHTIGQIVLQLLAEGHAAIDNLLIVTFTEKATGELKDRLRREIARAIDREPHRAVVLREQLDRFDQAAISTIHGFCRRLLRDYAADLGQDFSTELVDDAVHRRGALRDVQRIDWHQRYGEHLAEVLAAAGYRRGSEAAFEKCAMEIVRRYRPECGHQLLPKFAAERNGDVVNPADELLAFTVVRTIERLQEAKRRRGQMSFDDQIERVAAGLDPARNPRASIVIRAVRERFRFAIVDEFQDTDVLQWAIFRRLFLDTNEGGPRLIVVGDPKQAIYGFRGADLPTYLTAVDEMRSRYGAASTPLAINWRSSPELIARLNTFFGDGDLFPAERKITYTPVAAAPPELRRAWLARDDSGRDAIAFVDLDGEEATRPVVARKIYAQFLAAEIQRLLGGDGMGPLLTIADKSGERPLTASDICVLVFQHGEAKIVARELTRLGIPYSRYKSPGVHESQEARDLGFVLRALVHPDRERFFSRALLTIFFRATPMELMELAGRSAAHPGRLLFDRWRALAEDRKWGELFTSMLEETGVLFHDQGGEDHDRRVANLKLLVGQLQEAGYRGNLNLYELYELFVSGDYDPEANEDYQPQETDEPRVRIMTIHSAKGLEFPVVFLAGGFTNRTRDCVYRDELGRPVFNIPYIHRTEKSAELTARIDLENCDELRRLLYVALTRAQFKLYVPLMSERSAAKRCAVSALIQPAFVRSKLTSFPPPPREGKRKRRRKPVAVDAKGTLDPAVLLPEFDPGIKSRRIFVQSFTSLHRHQKKERAEAFGERAENRDELHPVLVEANEVFRGTVFGELVHGVFERVDYTQVRAARSESDLDGGAFGRLLDEYVPRFLPKLTTRSPEAQLAAECRRVLRQMAWRALRTPLAPLGALMCEVPAADRLQELEFLYPKRRPSGAAGNPDAGTGDYVKGFMDLVFRWKGAVYLLDWKTNVLPGYDRANLEAGMDEAGYHLQYQLYWEALSRWLPGATLGGVFYIYLRGLNGVDDSTGVYFVPGREVGGPPS